MPMWLSKTIDLERDFAAGVYLSEAPSPPKFLFGVAKQFCRFRIWCTLLQNMASNTTQHPSPIPAPPQSHTFGFTCTLNLGRGGGVNKREG